MENRDMIPASEFCIHHSIELSFIQSLNDYGLIEVVIINEKPFLPIENLDRTEMLVRLHSELGINLEGLDTVTHLIHRIKQMQAEIQQLTKELGEFEKE